MKFCLAVNDKSNSGENNYAQQDVDAVLVESETTRNTYKTLDNFLMVVEVTKLPNGAFWHNVSVYEDIANYIDMALVKEYVDKYSNQDIADCVDYDFLDMVNPSLKFIKTDLDLSPEQFNELEKALSVFNGRTSYIDITLPSFIQEDIDEIYSRHKTAQKVNMGYNIDLSCALAKFRLAKMTDESVMNLKKMISSKNKEEIIEENESTSGRSMTLRIVIKKD